MARPARPCLTPLGSALRAAREAASLSVSDMASHLGVSPEAVTSWEVGAHEPTGPKLLAYCRAVNLDPQTLPL